MNCIVEIPLYTRRLLARLLRWCGNLLLCLGIACAAWFLFCVGQARYYEDQGESLMARTKTEPFQSQLPPKAKGELIGQLEIPRLGLSAIVREGDDAGTLRVAVGHVPGTAQPGQPGNVALAAHRDGLFRRLRLIHPNDDIELVTPGGACRYRVDWVRVVSPKSTDVLKADKRPTLTLITCYPVYFLGPAPDRFVVRAHQISG